MDALTHGKIRALILVTADRVRIQWPRPLVALLRHTKTLGIERVRRLVPWALQLLTVNGETGGQAIAPGIVHMALGPGGKRVLDAAYFFGDDADGTSLADAILDVLQAAGVEQAADEADALGHSLFGFASDPRRFLRGHLILPRDDDDAAEEEEGESLTETSPLIAALLFYREDRVRRALERDGGATLPQTLWYSPGLADRLPPNVAEQLGNPLAALSPKERQWIAPLWEFVRQVWLREDR